MSEKQEQCQNTKQKHEPLDANEILDASYGLMKQLLNQGYSMTEVALIGHSIADLANSVQIAKTIELRETQTRQWFKAENDDTTS